MNEPTRVIVRVRGGMVEDVVCGAFVEVTVYDYDVEDVDEEFDVDEDGEDCIVTSWSSGHDDDARHRQSLTLDVERWTITEAGLAAIAEVA